MMYSVDHYHSYHLNKVKKQTIVSFRNSQALILIIVIDVLPKLITNLMHMMVMKQALGDISNYTGKELEMTIRLIDYIKFVNYLVVNRHVLG